MAQMFAAVLHHGSGAEEFEGGLTAARARRIGQSSLHRRPAAGSTIRIKRFLLRRMASRLRRAAHRDRVVHDGVLGRGRW
jgi:hypothetical protein